MTNNLVRGVGLGIGLTVVLNVLIYGLGRALTVSYLVARPGAAGFQTIGLGMVIGVSVVAALAGGLLAWFWGLDRDRSLTTFGWIAAVVALLSLLGPYSMARDSGSFVFLGLMHIGTALAIVYSLAHFSWRGKACA